MQHEDIVPEGKGAVILQQYILLCAVLPGRPEGNQLFLTPDRVLPGSSGGYIFPMSERRRLHLAARIFWMCCCLGLCWWAQDKAPHQGRSKKRGRGQHGHLRANQKKIKVITRQLIQRDGNEDIYDLEKYDY